MALIKNKAILNETVDPALIISRLKKENMELKSEIALLRGGERGPLENYEKEECKAWVEKFLEGGGEDGMILNDRLKI